jgi:L-2-hydroxyglutarate oxidase
MIHYDIILIGGGIVGVATAWQLKRRFPEASVLLVEKESALGRHQTGRNSGVIHAGVYYAPGSLKADFCRRGAAWTLEFCREERIPFEQCGKLLVATDEVELGRLQDLEERCRLNGIAVERLAERDLRRREPNIQGRGALLVRATGITDYGRITTVMAERFQDLGGTLRLAAPVWGLEETPRSMRVRVGGETLAAGWVLVCGGLMADRLARMLRLPIDFRIVPFRGEYYRLASGHKDIVRHLIYPVPDPALPFLGVHLTRMIDGSVTVGPNAVVGWKREGYGRLNVSLRDGWEMLTFPGFWKVGREHFGSGLAEMRDSLLTRGYVRRVRKYCPRITASDLRPHPVGIRAQAVGRDGRLVHDFLFAESPRSLHVCNAPSPAATSAVPIGEYLCAKLARKMAAHD